MYNIYINIGSSNIYIIYINIYIYIYYICIKFFCFIKRTKRTNTASPIYNVSKIKFFDSIG